MPEGATSEPAVSRRPIIVHAELYARYSSDLQRQTSIADQVRKCEEFGRAQGWFPAKGCIYKDEAISGVSTERPGLQRMLQAVVSTPITSCSSQKSWGTFSDTGLFCAPNKMSF